MNIPIEPEAMKTVVSGAIMGLLTSEKRDELITTAIKNLLTPSTNSWERGETMIQKVFNEALSIIARQEAERIIASDEQVKAKIRELLSDALVKVFETNRDKTIDNLASAIERGLTYQGR